MPDPFTVNTNTNAMEQDSMHEDIVRKALRRRYRRKPRPAAPPEQTYDKLAMLVPSVSKVLNNASYGASAGGFKPSVKTDSNNGHSESKVCSSPTTKSSSDGWPGLNKRAFGPATAHVGGNMRLGALGGAGLGALYGGLLPGEDEEGEQNNRLAAAAKYGLIGGGLGAAGGAGYAALMPLIEKLYGGGQDAPGADAPDAQQVDMPRQHAPTPAGVPDQMPNPPGW